MAIVAAIRQDMKELAETVGRKTKFAVSQPETRMSAIALGGWGSVKLLWWLNHLPADALAISAYPYQLAAVSTIGLAWGFYTSFGLKREADALPSLWERIRSA